MGDTADVVIVGGGPVGAALALKLGSAGREVVVLEPREMAAGTLRPVALSAGSRLILERIDAWEQLAPATAISRIHVSQRGGFGRAVLTARDVHLPALGYVVDHARMQTAFDALLARRRHIQVLRAAATRIVAGENAAAVEYGGGEASGTVRASLVVVADGGTMRDNVRSRVVDYGQTAVVAGVVAQQPHGNTAFERFTATGPLALLPWGERYALIWSVTPQRAQELCEAPEAVFAHELEEAFGGRLGAFSEVAQRASYPLVLRVIDDDPALPRLVRIGNAAQILHPVAGQGLNLGLRDAWELADEIANAASLETGGMAALAAFRARRRIDRRAGVAVTDALVRGFSNDRRWLRTARGLGLALLGCMPPVRDSVVRRMTFGLRA